MYALRSQYKKKAHQMQWVDKSKIVKLEREKNDHYKQRLHNGEGSINKTNKKKIWKLRMLTLLDE